MGGCRCTFRECENGTASRKDLHYFRYPVRDSERLKIWAKLANRMEFLDLPKEKLVNKVVCQEHFERSMFMNYLCDRLSRLAIPRLMTLSDGSVQNVETGELLWMDEDNETQKPNTDSPGRALVPYSPKPANSLVKINSVETVKSWDNLSSPEPPQKKMKILNSESMSINKKVTPCKVIRITTGPNKSDQSIRLNRVGALRKVCLPKTETHTLVKIQEDFSTGDEQEELGTESSIIDGIEIDEMPKSKIVSVVPPQKIQAPVLPVLDPMIVKKIEQNHTEISDLKRMVRELLDRPPPEPIPVTMLAPPTTVQKVVMEKGPSLTKAQLFSSIKRYLNPTMVTLLRMELFSGPTERQWKTDEKRLAVDLFNIGEQVYDHFVEEFRFRLPPKVEVNAWNEAGEIDVDDAC